jgi:DnaJ-class molecular chaperone
MNNEQIERLEKLKKLEEVSGQDIDSLISLFRSKTLISTDICTNCRGKGYFDLGPGLSGIRACSECGGRGRVIGKYRATNLKRLVEILSILDEREE